MTGTTAKLKLRDLHKSFGRKHVLDGLDLSVETGESLVVIGGSGTGKSVLLKCVLGLHHPDAGEILLDGEDVTGLSGPAQDALLRRFGMLFQGGALFDSLRIWENVAFGLIRGQGMARKQAREVALENIARVGMGAEVADLYPAEISGGMQKRVALARAIATRPEIIFFDEPTTGLDPIMADVINHLIRKCVNEFGMTAVSITHDMQSVRHIADRVAMLHRGRIQWCGPVDELDTTDEAHVRQFVEGRSEGPIELPVMKG